MNHPQKSRQLLALAVGAAMTLLVFTPQSVAAHCDALDGPVVVEARQALTEGGVEPLLKWVDEKDEAQVRSAFQQTRTVRELGTEARELADQYFFETLVRLHRASEGEAFTGLKPVGTPVDAAVRLSDQALE